MKKLILPLVTLLLFSFSMDTSKLSDEDRKKAVDHLENTRDEMAKILKGLSEAQLNFKAEEDSWSIAECAEHIAISENMIFGMLQGALQTAADPSKRAEVKMSDEELIGIIESREQKVKTREPFEPTGKYGSHEATVNEFLAKRNEHISYIKSTEDDLRNHYGQLPFGTVDGVQILLFMSGHTERHLDQMKEVMAHKLFPKG
ncbi:DinB family protein [uncultured Allomuricauda sp.]|uniref:DinB family protein n=1 Tax=Flagellimonas sp. W118 TaxID=3410791 RepID=UPI002634113B|nr:DinB family protein [uncultured Allomuricauda sp.]